MLGTLNPVKTTEFSRHKGGHIKPTGVDTGEGRWGGSGKC